jgi:polyhydroxyalkanoate synthase
MRWINKFLRPRSPAKEYVDPLVCRTGNTVFVISWINPDARLRDKSFEHYMLEGAIAAMAAVEKATGERAVNGNQRDCKRHRGFNVMASAVAASMAARL